MADDLRSRIAHLARRSGFGATPAEIDASVARGYDATVDALFDTSPDPGADATPAQRSPSSPPFLAFRARKRRRRTW